MLNRFRRTRRFQNHPKLERACVPALETLRRNGKFLLIPLGAAASMLTHSAPGQTLMAPGSSTDPYFNMNFDPVDNAGSPPGSQTSTLSTKAVDGSWTNNINPGDTASKFQLSIGSSGQYSAPQSVTDTLGNSSAGAAGGLYAVTQFKSEMGIFLNAGTGVWQTDTDSSFAGNPSTLTIGIDSVWALTNAFPPAALAYQLPIGGQVGIGGTDSVSVNLAFDYTAPGGGSTTIETITNGASYTNSTNQPTIVTSVLSGLVLVPQMQSGGTFSIVGSITFNAINDLSPSQYIAPTALPPVVSDIAPETFLANGVVSWNTAANWSGGFIPGTGGYNTAIFTGAAGDTLSLNGNQTVSAIDFQNTAPITVLPGTGSASIPGTLTLQDNVTGTDNIMVENTNNTISANVILDSSDTQLTVNDPGAVLDINGNISNASGVTTNLTIAGPGTVLLASNDNTYNGTTTIAAGAILQIGSDASQGGDTGTGNVVDNGTLNFNAHLDAETTFTNSISGAGGVLQTGNNGVVLSGDNSYTGQTEVDEGEIQFGSSTALGDSSVVLKAEGADIDLYGYSTTISGLSGPAGTIDNSSENHCTLTVATSVNGEFDGVIENSGGGPLSLVKSGLGVLALGNQNTYSGSTTLNAGTLEEDFNAGYTTANILPTSTALILNGGTFDVEAAKTVGNQQLAATTVLGGPNAIIGNGSGLTLLLGSLSRLPSSMGATVEFQNPTYAGGIATPFEISTSIRQLGILGSTSDGLLYSDYATFGTSDWAVQSFPSLGIAQVFPGSGVPTFYTSPTVQTTGTLGFSSSVVGTQVNADVNSSGEVAFAGGTLTSIRFNDPTGGLANVDANDIDQLVLGGTLANGGYLVTPNVGANNVLITPDNGGVFTQSQLLSPGAITQDVVIWQNNTAGLLVLNTGISDSLNSGAGLTKAGPGDLVLNSSSTYTGPTNIEGGGVEIGFNRELGAPNSTGVLGQLNLNGGTLIAVSTMTLDNGSTEPRTITVGPYGGGLVAVAGQTLTIDGPITDSPTGNGRLEIGSFGSFSLAQVSGRSNTLITSSANGNGTVVLIGSMNGFSGQIVVAGGNLQVGNGTTGGSLGNGQAIVTDDGLITFDLPAGDNPTLATAIGGIGGLNQIGPGILTVTGFDTYQGPTTIAPSSTLIVGGLDGIPLAGGIYNTKSLFNDGSGTLTPTNTGSVLDNGQLTFNLPAGTDYVVNNPISGTGGITVSATGATVSFTGSNTFTGKTAITNGDLVLGGTGALGTNLGQVNMNSGAMLDLDGFNLSLLALNGNGGTILSSPIGSVTLTINNSANSSFGGNIVDGGGPVALVKTGAGSLFLSGTNTYSGGTNVEAGTLVVNSNGALSGSGDFLNGSNAQVVVNATAKSGPFDNSGTLTINAGAMLTVNGSFFQGSGLTNVLGTLQVLGGPLTLYSGSLGLSGRIDLTNSEMTLSYAGGPSPIAAVQAALASGFADGAWNGVGIDSSSIASLNKKGPLIYALGYADGADGHTSVSSGVIEIMPTLAGDALLQGSVQFSDFQIVLADFGKSEAWDQGDFDYGPVVDFYDFQSVLLNFGQSDQSLTGDQLATINQFAAQFDEEYVANAGGVGYSIVSVPEPASLGLLGAGGAGLLARRRRTSRKDFQNS